MTFVPPDRSSRFLQLLRRKGLGARRRLRRILRPASSSRPVFVVGCGRSGTDLIVAALAQSTRVDTYNEDNPAAFVRWKLRDLPVLDDIIEGSRADVVVFKPIVETHRIGELLARWPGSSAVFVTRHPWDTINSMVRFFENPHVAPRSWFSSEPSDPVPSRATEALHTRFCHLYRHASTPEDHNALSWWVRNAVYFELGLDRNPHVAISEYGALTKDPVGVFRALAEFVGIEYASGMARLVRTDTRPRHTPSLAPVIRDACTALWQRLHGSASGACLTA